MKKLVLALSLAGVALTSCANSQDSTDLIPSLEKLAEQGNAEAIYHIGMAYQTGAGLPQNPEMALASFREAAALGDVLAAYKLGCYYDGQGQGLIANDPDLALQHKLVAAEAGYALAQQDVAALYARQGDYDSAIAWIERAAAQGWGQALATYASIYNGAEGITPDPVLTAAYFQLFIQRNGGSEEQTDWLDDFRSSMSADDRQAADRIVSSYRPTPTELTMKALSGQRAAELLVTN